MPEAAQAQPAGDYRSVSNQAADGAAECRHEPRREPSAAANRKQAPAAR